MFQSQYFVRHYEMSQTRGYAEMRAEEDRMERKFLFSMLIVCAIAALAFKPLIG